MRSLRFISSLAVAALVACTPSDAGDTGASAAPSGDQASVKDDVSQPDVAKVAVGSKDHTTLVAALQAADLVNSLANVGPFTVFAPNNAAFDALPAGTVEDLLKPANKSKLRGILLYPVTTSALDLSYFQDGQVLGMADGGRRTGDDHPERRRDLHRGGEGAWLGARVERMGARD